MDVRHARTEPICGRENEELGREGCCLLNKRAQRPFSVSEATEHCQACIPVANRSPPKIKSDCLDTTSWKRLWLLSSPEPCWGMSGAGWHPAGEGADRSALTPARGHGLAPRSSLIHRQGLGLRFSGRHQTHPVQILENWQHYVAVKHTYTSSCQGVKN